MKIIKLNVVKYKKDFFYYIFQSILCLLVIYWFIAILITIVKPEGHNPIIFKIGLVWLLTMVLISIFKKTYLVIGKILLSDEYIEIDYLNKKYHLNELQDLTFDVGGYRWQPHLTGKIITFSNGINNTLSFIFKDQKFTYRFLIKNRKELKIIQDYINKLI